MTSGITKKQATQRVLMQWARQTLTSRVIEQRSPLSIGLGTAVDHCRLVG